MSNSYVGTAMLLTNPGCSATVAENSKDKADEAFNQVVSELAGKGVTVSSTIRDPKRHLYTVLLSNGNSIFVRWM